MNPSVRIGSCSFTAAGWERTFYPPRLRPGSYLRWYAEEFDTLEIDSTFYRSPSIETVRGWYRATPPDFSFALKVPRSITHDRCLESCEDEFQSFLSTAMELKEKLGFILLQFPYFNQQTFSGPEPFLQRLEAVLSTFPSDLRFAVELRNKNWIDPRLAEVMERYHGTIALIDHPWMWRPAEMLERLGNPQLESAYIRLLGDRHEIELLTKLWDRAIVDRTEELAEWTDICVRLSRRGTSSFVYVNNHYAGHAPATMRELRERLGDAVVKRPARDLLSRPIG